MWSRAVFEDNFVRPNRGVPDYAMLVVDSNRGGVVGMLKEHLGIVLGLKIPFVVCVTKMETHMCADHLLQSTMESLFALVKATWGTQETDS